MNSVTRQVYEYCVKNELISDGVSLIVGISGGADSVCLLRMLDEIRSEALSLDIHAVHIEHGIRGEESIRDMEFVEGLCASMNIPLKIYRFDVINRARELNMTVEEAGRYLRYEAFNKELVLQGADCIAVAHHMNDQAETVIFNMIRGSGVRGVGGIAPKRDKIVRPLLKLSREAIEAYLNEINQKYCIDSTNEDTDYSRNSIRQIVIPELNRVADRTVEHISKLADELREADAYIFEHAMKAREKAVTNKNTLYQVDINMINEYPPIIVRYVVRSILADIYSSHKDLESQHVEGIVSLLNKQSGRMINLPKGIIARRENDRILIGQRYDFDSTDKADIGIELVINGETLLDNGDVINTEIFEYREGLSIPEGLYTKWFDYDRINANAVVRHRHTGDYFTIGEDEKKKKLKNYLIDEKIPLTDRDAIYLIADENHIVWALGYRISEHYKINKDTKRVLQIKYEIK